MKKILLIAYQFPPYAGVGAFRWAQLCKYLARMGHEIHVITVNWDDMGSNTLIEAVQHKNIHIHRIASGYPHNFRLKKYKYHIFRALQRRVFEYYYNKKYLHDMAEPWAKFLIPYATKVIKQENISVVVATGAPFMVNVHAAKLKEQVPSIKLVQDMRDLWFSHELNNIKGSIFYEKYRELETYALQGADAVVTVSETCCEAFARTAGNTKIHLVRNGFDPVKFEPLICEKTFELHFVHLGTTFSGREKCFQAFLNFMRYEKRATATFAGEISHDILQNYSELLKEKRFKYVGKLSQMDCVELLKQADFAVHFNGAATPENASTKIYEYAAAKIPVFSLNFGKDVHRLIEKYNLGLSFNLQDVTVSDISAKLSTFDFSTFQPQNVADFSYVNIAKQYSKIINEL